MDVELNRAGDTPAAGRAGEDDLLGVIADVERQLAGLKAVRAEREELRKTLESREAAINQRESDLQAIAQRLQAAEREHESRGQELDRLEAMVREQRGAIEAETAALAQERERASAEGRKRDEESRTRTQAIQEREQTLKEREQRLAENAAGLSRQREALEQRAAALSEHEQSLRERESALADQRRQLDQDRQQASAQAAAGATQIKQLEKALADAKRELARSGEAQASLIAELDQTTKAAEESAAGLRSARTDADNFKRQLIDRDERIQELGKKLAAATEKLREVSRSIHEQSDALGQARAMEADLKARDERIAELESRIASAPVAAAGDPQAGERASKLEESLREAHAELAAALADNKRLRAKASSRAKNTGGEVPQEIGEAIARRWERLRLMRSVLKEQGEKIRHAGEALRARYEQCEQILKQREELMTARNAITETKRKLERLQTKAAKGRAIAGVFYALMVLAGLGGMSWAVAGQFAPATYVARATIAADVRGQSVAQDLVAAWQQYHQAALSDPAMVEVAADRMSRRGIASLSNPGALAQRLKTDMNEQSTTPGQITVELRGRGAGPTTRELETFIAAVVSQSNATRERRPDGLSTIVSEPPNTIGGPIEDQRPVYALATFAIGCGVSLILGVAIWRRLAAAKLRFEEEETADVILDAANWNRPPEVFLKP